MANVSDYRTTVIKNAGRSRFAYAKDPADESWWQATFGEVLASGTVTVSPSGLTVGEDDDEPVLSSDKKSLQFRLSGGTSATTYALSLTVETASGDTLNRTVDLDVRDL